MADVLLIKNSNGGWENVPAIKGENAYEIAVRNGYKGTLEEWLGDETARVEAESKRRSSELNREANELSRKNAETNRANAEEVRIGAETTRKTAEASRVAAETEREAAEALRKDTHAQMKQIFGEAQYEEMYDIVIGNKIITDLSGTPITSDKAGEDVIREATKNDEGNFVFENKTSSTGGSVSSFAFVYAKILDAGYKVNMTITGTNGLYENSCKINGVTYPLPQTLTGVLLTEPIELTIAGSIVISDFYVNRDAKQYATEFIENKIHDLTEYQEENDPDGDKYPSAKAAKHVLNELENIKEEQKSHKKNTDNPHKVTVEQVGTYDKNSIDEKDSSISTNLTAKIDEHKENQSNPHKVTAEQVGAYTKEEGDEKFADIDAKYESLSKDFNDVFEKYDVGVGKNILDTSKSVVGFINKSGEIDETATSYHTSDFISVSSGENIVFSALRKGGNRENRTSACTYNAYSDEETVVERKVMPQVSYYTVPENAVFIRVSYDVSLFEQWMIEKGTEMTDYEPFQGVVEEIKIKDGVITIPEKVSELENDAGYITADEAITNDEMFDLVPSKNRLNLNDDNYIIGQAVSSGSGNPTEYADGAISGYIAVVSGENLVASARRIADGENGYRTNQTVNARWYGYDENKQYISSAYMFGGKDYYTVPEGIAYIRVAHNTKVYTEWMVEVGAVNTAYEVYKEPVKVIKNGLYKSTPHNSKPLALPQTIYAFANLPIMTYLRNIMVYDINDVYVSMLTSSKGKLYKDRWEYTPNKAETFIAKYIIENHNGDVLNSKDVNIIVKVASEKDSLTALVIGDSTVEAGVETEKMSALATAENYSLTLLGTKGNEAKNNWHEGRGGWTAQDYCEKASKPNSNGQAVTNAFYNPATATFDFSYYMTQQGYSGVDCVFIQLGINDLFGYKEDTELARGISNYLSNLEKMINSIHSYDANIKIVLNMIIPCINDQDKFTEIYGMTQTTWRCRKNTYEGNISLMNRFSNVENVYISSYNSAIDTVNNIPSDVHPSVDGYNQLGTQMYGFMRAIN